MENRNLELGGLSYTHSKLDSLHNEAYTKALKKSEVLADKLLEALPEDKKEVLKIGNVEITSSAPQAERFKGAVTTEQADASSTQSIGINTGTMKINAILYVEYQIR